MPSSPTHRGMVKPEPAKQLRFRGTNKALFILHPNDELIMVLVRGKLKAISCPSQTPIIVNPVNTRWGRWWPGTLDAFHTSG